VVANAEALRLAGSTTLRPTRRAAGLGVTRTGSPTACCGSGRKVAVQSHLPEASIQDIARQLEKAAEEYLSAGVTSVVDAALGLANGMQDAEA